MGQKIACPQGNREITRPSQIAAQLIEARDASAKDDRNRCGCRFGSLCRGLALYDDHRDATANKIDSQRRKSVELILRSTELDRQIAK
jgi:hypothetical protein